ncbi:antA/AntB antirepressor family protein [Methylobacterium dankookense]|uniref:AntA/AntB antirepressor domain-containing protein n=1 Tax=Methylobacterium dankookense TaxID=560405 RepID=A0A564G550_9HYPH|nr:antA/AntB antirepressor family protein [Methylobacterium dankookense]GJD58366.1 hypothetical protein IFDJLNFL_4285 [Methylobacterium dankookense]VUF15629.1 hypothetical protein MTDSW087_05373 [Methylobacterium dankookense]
MMPAISETPIGATVVQTVNARELHAFLENRDHFATWIKDRIRVYGFAEGVDFTTYSAVSEKGGRPSVEYALTIDTAKELAMVERNARGREARRYFIDCERRAKAAAPAVPQTLPEALRLAADLAEKVTQQAEAIAVLEPRAAALDTLAETEGTFCTRDAAKALAMPEKDLRAYLAGNGWIYRRARNEPWCARAERLSAGLMRTKVIPVETGSGKPWNRPQARITSRGLALLATRLGKPVPPEAQSHLSLTASERRQSC